MKKNTIIKSAILILFIGSYNTAFAWYGSSVKGLTFNYGSNFRFDKMYRHNFSIEKWEKSSGCTYSFLGGYGANFEFSNTDNYNFGLKAYICPSDFRRAILYTIGITPSIYSINNHWGLNIAPEIGIPLHFLNEGNKYGGSVNLYYGYEIPIINEKSYTLNRHRLTLIIGFDLNRIFLKKKIPNDINTKE